MATTWTQEKIIVLTKIVHSLMAIALASTTWFLLQLWDKQNNLEKVVYGIQLEQAKTSSNRFTSNDWVINKSVLDSERLALDRRLIKLEETIPIIKDSNIEIKQSIGEIKKLIAERHKQ